MDVRGTNHNCSAKKYMKLDCRFCSVEGCGYPDLDNSTVAYVNLASRSREEAKYR
jgi:hypothetical protein